MLRQAHILLVAWMVLHIFNNVALATGKDRQLDVVHIRSLLKRSDDENETFGADGDVIMDVNDGGGGGEVQDFFVGDQAVDDDYGGMDLPPDNGGGFDGGGGGQKASLFHKAKTTLRVLLNQWMATVHPMKEIWCWL